MEGVSLSISNNSKVGIIGRTGAGKSSIIQALYRTIEPEEGSVYMVGGQNALEMGLHSLRQSLSIIPQTPFLFKGSIASNIDPFHLKSEEEVWSVLQTAGLKEYVQNVNVLLFSYRMDSIPSSPPAPTSSQWGRSNLCVWPEP